MINIFPLNCMQLSSLRVFHWLIMFYFLYLIILIIMKLVFNFQRVFRPRWTCIQCTMQTALADAFGQKPPRDIQKWFLLVFVSFLCAILFSGIRHTRFCSLFPPTFQAPTKCVPFIRLACISGLGLTASLFSSSLSSSSLPFLIIFPVGSAWPSKKCNFQGELSLSSLFIKCIHLRPSCWCHLLLAFVHKTRLKVHI